MRSDFSRTMAFFNLAQTLIESTVQEEDMEDYAVFHIDQGLIKAACIECIGREPTDEEWPGVRDAIGMNMPDILKSCCVFNLAHLLYHALED